MTPRQKLYKAWQAHCCECEQCRDRLTFESPRCEAGDKIFKTWWGELRDDFPQRTLGL